MYNIDENGIITEYRPQNVVAARGYQPQVIMDARSKTVTVIRAVNAVGSQIPPFLANDAQFDERSKSWYCLNCNYVRWSNAEIFRKYLPDHFM